MNNNKKNHILQAAIKVFAEKNYSDATIADIAKEAIITEGLIYHYFKNKTDILLEIFLSIWKDINKKTQKKLLSLNNKKNPAYQLRLIIQTIKSSLATNRQSLYRAKVLHEFLPHYFLTENIKHKKELVEKREQIKHESKKFFSQIDRILDEGLKNRDQDNPKVVRQILFGAFEMLLYGLFLKIHNREKNILDYDYTAREAEQSINNLISFYVAEYVTKEKKF